MAMLRGTSGLFRIAVTGKFVVPILTVSSLCVSAGCPLGSRATMADCALSARVVPPATPATITVAAASRAIPRSDLEPLLPIVLSGESPFIGPPQNPMKAAAIYRPAARSRDRESGAGKGSREALRQVRRQ